MNSDNLVKRGFRPWLPSADASRLDAWHEYEVPLVGTFECPQGLMLFALVGDLDPDRQVSVWAYTPISTATAAKADFASSSELNTWVRERFIGAQVVYAMARDFAVHRWGAFERVESIHEGAMAFMDQVLEASRVEEAVEKNPKLGFEVLQAEVGVLVDHVPAMN